MSTYAQNKKENGSVEFEGKELACLSQAYVDQDFNYAPALTYYTCKARDEEGNYYRVMWQMTNEEAEEEENCCDWDDYSVEFDHESEW
jgi:hypothetical protein